MLFGAPGCWYHAEAYCLYFHNHKFDVGRPIECSWHIVRPTVKQPKGLHVLLKVYVCATCSVCQVLASYINPAGCVSHGESPTGESRGHNSNALPTVLQELLSQSCLIPAMSSYLRNDSGEWTLFLRLCVESFHVGYDNSRLGWLCL
jgi:hypothetical protein